MNSSNTEPKVVHACMVLVVKKLSPACTTDQNSPGTE